MVAGKNVSDFMVPRGGAANLKVVGHRRAYVADIIVAGGAVILFSD